MARPTILPQFPAGLGGGGHHIYMHSLAFLRILQTLNVIATTENIIGHIGDTPIFSSLNEKTNKTLSPLHIKRSNRTREQNQNSNFVCNKNSQNVSL